MTRAWDKAFKQGRWTLLDNIHQTEENLFNMGIAYEGLGGMRSFFGEFRNVDEDMTDWNNCRAYIHKRMIEEDARYKTLKEVLHKDDGK